MSTRLAGNLSLEDQLSEYLADDDAEDEESGGDGPGGGGSSGADPIKNAQMIWSEASGTLCSWKVEQFSVAESAE